jgi:DNA repair photolyase
MSLPLPIQGRGASHNPANRFVPIDIIPDEDHDPREDPSPTTQFLKDFTKSIIATNDSPDVGFTHSLNPYRGCEHGCVYCYARPTHEYFGLSAGLDFETKIFVKESAPELLRKELSKKSWKQGGGKTISIGGVTDPYQPIERKLKLTRRCLQVLLDFRNPTAIVTKNHLVTRDIDILQELAKFNASAVFVSVTTLDPELSSKMEPRTASPRRRLDAIRELSSAGIPTGVMVAPCIPGLTDHEIPGILQAARDAGASAAGFVPVRLPGAVAPLFEQWLTQHFPDRKNKILNRIRDMRAGNLNDPNFTTRMQGSGQHADQLHDLFHLAKRRFGYPDHGPDLCADHFRIPPDLDQPMLFQEE